MSCCQWVTIWVALGFKHQRNLETGCGELLINPSPKMLNHEECPYCKRNIDWV